MDINTVADARKCIGKILYWDDIGQRYIFLRQGKLEAVSGGNLQIDGNWKWRKSLKNLRDTKDAA